MNQDITINNLIIEVTRKCNMTCKHCLRGDAQNIDIDTRNIRSIIMQSKNINQITFTGGEPSLNIDAIDFTLRLLKTNKMPLDSFYVVTNAKQYSERFVRILNQYYLYCMDNLYDHTVMLKPDDKIPNTTLWEFYGGLAVSHDNYHDEIPLRNYMRYALLSYYQHDKEDLNNGFILDMGNANKNNLGNHKHDIQELDIEEWTDGYTIESLYLSATGEILADCDLSYDMQNKHSYGNIMTDTLLEIIEKNKN